MGGYRTTSGRSRTGLTCWRGHHGQAAAGRYLKHPPQAPAPARQAPSRVLHRHSQSTFLLSRPPPPTIRSPLGHPPCSQGLYSYPTAVCQTTYNAACSSPSTPARRVSALHMGSVQSATRLITHYYQGLRVVGGFKFQRKIGGRLRRRPMSPS